MPKNHRVLYISSQFPAPLTPHAGMFSLQRVLALRKAGCKVRVVCPIGINPPLRYLLHPVAAIQRIRNVANQPEQLVVQGIQAFYPKWGWPPKAIIGWYASTWLYWQIRRPVLKLVDEFHPDVILSSWLPDGIAACKLSKSLGIPTMVIAEGSDVNKFPRQYRGWNYARDLLNKQSAVLVFVSEALRNTGNSVGLSGRKNIVLPNAVDTDLFHTNDSRREDDRFTILSVGRLVPVKGYSTLLVAFSNIYQQLGPQARLILVGNGPLHSELAEQAATLGISSSVDLAGAVDHQALVAYYQKADIFCLSSFSEGFPCAVVEAMACGKPVVASNVGGVGEVVDEQSGILVAPGDAKALSNAILQARSRVWDAQGIRRKIVAGFNWSHWTNTILNQIELLVG